MIIHRIEYGKFDNSPHMEIDSGDHYVILMHRTRVRCTIPGWPACEGTCVFAFLRPGTSVEVERLDQLFSYDLLEFSPEPGEQQLMNTLLLPTVPHSPNYFYGMSAVLKTIHHTYYSADKYRTQKINAHFLLILYGMADGDEDPSGMTGEHLLYHKLRRLRVLVSDDPSKNWNVKDAADYVGLSESRFSVVYKKYFSTTFINDVIRVRIQQGCVLLSSTEMSIGEISKICGYDSEPFFHRQFKQQTGITPGEYRRLNYREV